MTFNTQCAALLVAFVALIPLPKAISDGRVTTGIDSTVISTTISSSSDAGRIAFPEKKRSYTDASEKKESVAPPGINTTKSLSQGMTKSSETSYSESPASITIAEPFQITDEPKETPRSTVHKRVEIGIVPMQTISPKTTAPQPTDALTVKPSFVPNLSDLSVDNPTTKPKKANPTRKTARSEQKKPTLRDDMPQSYDISSPASSQPTTSEPTATPRTTLKKTDLTPGYRSYTITDPGEVERINMDCVVSVDQDPVTGAFVIKAKEDCK